MSRIRSSVGDVGGRLHRGSRVGFELLGHHHVDRDRHLGAARFHRQHHGACLVHQVGLGKALADRLSSGEHEGVGDAAADDQAVDLVGQALQDRELGAHLAARHDGQQRPLRRLQRLREGVDLGGEQRARHRRPWRIERCRRYWLRRGGQCRRRRARRCRRARPSCARALSSFFFSPLLRRQFSSSTTWPGETSTPSTQFVRSGTCAAKQFAQALRHRCQRVFGLELTLGRSAQVRRDHHRGAGVERHANARQRGADARVFGDGAAVVLRDVEVGSDEDALAA